MTAFDDRLAKLTIHDIAVILRTKRIAFMPGDLRAVQQYLRSQKRCIDYDALSAWVQMCVNEVEKA